MKIISPAWASGEPESIAIPATKLLAPNSPPEILILRALTLILPPPAALTSTSEPLVKVISALATPLGKLRLASALIPISPAADNPPNSTLAPPAKIFPPSKSTLPPIRVMLSPVATSKPLPLLATD